MRPGKETEQWTRVPAPALPDPTPPHPHTSRHGWGAGPSNTLWPGRRKENEEGTQGAGSRPGPPSDRRPRAGVQYSTRGLRAGMDPHPHPRPPHSGSDRRSLWKPQGRALLTLPPWRAGCSPNPELSRCQMPAHCAHVSLRGGLRLLLQGAHLGRACLRGLGTEGGREGVVLATPEARPRVPGPALQGPLSASSRKAPEQTGAESERSYVTKAQKRWPGAT